MRTKTLLASVAALAVVPMLAACTENASSGDDGGKGADARALTVGSSADGCELSATKAPAGTLSFDVTNTGSDVTEFYLLEIGRAHV